MLAPRQLIFGLALVGAVVATGCGGNRPEPAKPLGEAERQKIDDEMRAKADKAKKS